MTPLKESNQTYEMILTNESTVQTDGSTNFLVISLCVSIYLAVHLSLFLRIVHWCKITLLLGCYCPSASCASLSLKGEVMFG